MLIKHLFESKPSVNVSQLLDTFKLKEFVQENCQPYLQAIGNDINEYVLYRGRSAYFAPEQNYQVFTSHADRRPMSTRPDLQILYDNILEQLFGWRPRQQGVFATGDFHQARAYAGGEEATLIFFPIGEFKFIWSESTRDLYSSNLMNRVENCPVLSFLISQNKISPEDYESLLRKNIPFMVRLMKKQGGIRTVKKLTRDAQLIVKYIKSGNMKSLNQMLIYEFIRAEFILASHPEFTEDQQIANFLDRTIAATAHMNYVGIQSAMDTLRKNYKDTNLPKAIKAHNEIMFKCNTFMLMRHVPKEA